MQYFDEIARGFGSDRGSAKAFAEFLHALFEAQDDEPNMYKSGKGIEIQQATWKLMADIPDYHPACAKVLEGLIEGLAAGCGRGIAVKMTSMLGRPAPLFWS